ncbi:MAG TPA: NAD(P)/FAD-dependent oxidoreductase [Usitatibacter sp.]|jgi:NADPH-dependent 2,4-dienoyl-CoA reductase/sulfur reductase-like enzyme|nr:NAD(P)/FAD-dependent oxidoreductase [Usitatibacter sp.]
MRRREFLKGGAALLVASQAGCAAPPAALREKARVVVIGGGYAGATAARYLRTLDPSIAVTLVEVEPAFVACPLSNQILGGSRTLAQATRPYTSLERNYGVHRIQDRVTAVDPQRRVVRLASGGDVAYDRVIVAGGIDFVFEELPAMGRPDVASRVFHAWKGGEQAAGLRRQLEAMRDGGVFAIAIPEAPYRCPPAPYERACQVAAYFQSAKPRSKILVLDANGDIASMGTLFKKAWSELYGGMIEYRPNSKAVDVDLAGGLVKLELEDVKADVMNVIPPMKAANVASPFITVNHRWCEVDWLTYESKVAPGVHVLGDSIQVAPVMPKSASMANAQAKVCAQAIVALLAGEAPNPAPTLLNTCYSMVSPKLAIHVASVHKYDPKERTMRAVPGAGGLSPAMNELEASYADDWVLNTWADALG